ncbi:SDR family NAD(P)-dependent oxidoreductase [Luteimicrobium subarcticum]|uniref:Short-subunit dehydrogenase n=1 Tax=Luteimicrobium subarcticum TaxID=620910 RepID=A0A2M8WS55_9MICO|nr:SDR family NAD(P)-dependent oxidoreductase [Luteimicrobium subarcticum]PJI93759.1 hypothetical protein CLV34_1234 [Luteimicrobium subarcticum]
MATALITGASAGLGLEFAWQLATARHDLVLVARDEERLHDVARQLRSAAGIDVEVLRADLSVPDDLARVAQRVADPERPVSLLVNNAGFPVNQRFVGGDLSQELLALDVLVKAVLVLAHAAADAMVTRGRGAILNVASVAALTTSGTYSAHKAWVRTFTEVLAVQLKGTGVTATALCPGLTHTEFHERAGVDTSNLPDIAWLDAESVVSAALADVRRGVVISTPSLRYTVASGFLRAIPRSAVRALDAGGLTGMRGRWAKKG